MLRQSRVFTTRKMCIRDSLYSFRDQLDMLTVSTTYKSTLADVYAIGYKGTYYDSTILHNSTWHKYTVNYLCTWSYLSSGKDYGIGNLAFNYTALGLSLIHI